jgi:hypothetical protein
MRLTVASTWEGIRVGKLIGLFVEAYGCDVPATLRMPGNMTACQFSKLARAAADG